MEKRGLEAQMRDRKARRKIRTPREQLTLYVISKRESEIVHV